jgi:hypothetical protein
MMVADNLREFYEAKARERQACGQGGVLLPVNFPEAKGDARDRAGRRKKATQFKSGDAAVEIYHHRET